MDSNSFVELPFRETNKIVLYFIVLFSSEKRTAFLLQNRSLLHRNPNQNRFTSSPRVSFYFIATLTQNPSTSSPRVSFYIRRKERGSSHNRSRSRDGDKEKDKQRSSQGNGDRRRDRDRDSGDKYKRERERDRDVERDRRNRGSESEREKERSQRSKSRSESRQSDMDNGDRERSRDREYRDRERNRDKDYRDRGMTRDTKEPDRENRNAGEGVMSYLCLREANHLLMPAKFVVSDTNKFHKKWIYTSLGKRWRERWCFLFNKYYDWALTVEQNIEQFLPEVTKDHWAMYLNYRLSPDTMAKADKNALNRQKQRIPHTLGTRSLARTKDIMEQRDGRSYTRGNMYEISHTKRNGSYVNDEARQKNEELQKERQTSSDNETFVTVFGKEHHGYVRGMGLGPTPSQINGSSCRPSGSTFSSTADAKIAKMQSEIDVLTKEVAEVNELKAKVAEFDAMKEQFALIMANMQNHGSNIGSPFKVRRSSQSSHNVEGDQATPDD
ncbi:hypothetical protein QL285_026511 [Trifolium repens]|nr:hypothetical protein QL285_026511 [Trifolium repens]